ncbi:MAG: enoyl-CoA hydratase/isomerase family protein [Bacteroidota bacterium]
MEFQHLIYDRQEAVVRVILNRPKSLNAFNRALLQEMKTAFQQISEDPTIKVVVLSGEGRAFSAGVDLKETDADGFQDGATSMKLGRELSELMTQLPQVTIAQVHGYCFTGALEMMMFFDMAFCAESTQFGDTHAKWSVMPQWGMTQRLARRVGLAKAKELSFRAMRIKGPEAERIGLVNRAFPDDQLASEVDTIITEILQNSFEAISVIKHLYDEGYAGTLRDGLELESNADTRLSDTDAQLSQFQEKKFKG